MNYLIRTIFLLFIAAPVLYLSIAFYVGKEANHDTKISSDVILVLGAKAFHGKVYNPCLVSRVSHAVDLYT